MNEEEIIKLADTISFRLLATRNHTDYDWLVDTLKQTINNKEK